MNHDPLAWIDDELTSLKTRQLRRQLTTRSGAQRAQQVHIDDQPLVNFSSNDYLGYAAELATFHQQAWFEDGWGSGASPAISGRSELHEQLEAQLARFERTEAALLFSSGYAANTGCIPALAGPTDAVFSDEKNHASIIDGCRLSGAEIAVYRHLDLDQLAELLEQHSTARRRLIVTDSLFSMDGDLAPLVQLSQLAQQSGAMLMVDEAHATGVLGPGGRGLAEELGVADQVDVRVGTLSKALGSAGGFVAGSAQLIQWLSNRARSYVFSTAPPPPLAAAALQALLWVDEQPERRQQLLAQAAQLRQQLGQQGWQVCDHASQLIAIRVGDPGLTLQLSSQLRQQGLLVPAIRPPTVPEGQSLLRISISYNHQVAECDQLLAALASCRSLAQ